MRRNARFLARLTSAFEAYIATISHLDALDLDHREAVRQA